MQSIHRAGPDGGTRPSRSRARSAWRAALRASLHALLLTLAALQLPATAAPSRGEADSPAWAYRIQPGDTLIGLTAAYLVDGSHWRTLQKLNCVADPLRLPPGGTLLMPISLLRREASVAQAVFTQGEVQLLRAGSAPAGVVPGTELRSGDRLRTGAQSSLTLRFADGSRLLLAPDSEVAIEQLLVYGRSALPAMQLRLERGSADNHVQPRPDRPAQYEMRAPRLNLGVRGTEFRVQVAEGDSAASSSAQVLSGVVAASGDKATSALRLEAGRGVVATAGGLQTGPLLNAPDLSAVPDRIERLPLRLGWARTPGAAAWRAQVFAEGDFERLLLDGRFDQPRAQFAVRAELPDGRYSLRVRAIDALGLEGLAADRTFTLKARPEPPFASAPAPAATVYGDALELAWTRSLQARSYRLQVARDPDFAQPLFDRSELDATSARVALPPGAYHWRLASIAAGADQGPFGDAQQATLKPIPPSPPPAEPELADDGLHLRWAAAPGVASYQLQWARDAEFSQLLAEPSTESPSLSLPRPGPGRYYLRVRSLDETGHAGPWGGTQLIEVPQPRWLWLLPLALLLAV